MTIAIDTNILLDILIRDKKYFSYSKTLLDKYCFTDQLIICELVYAELACQFSSSSELNNFLADTEIRLVFSNENSLSLACERWKIYLKNRTNKFQCSQCGQKVSFNCPQCNNLISSRQHILSDFIIGAHALTHSDLFLSRDRGFYRTYFSDMRIEGTSP